MKIVLIFLLMCSMLSCQSGLKHENGDLAGDQKNAGTKNENQYIVILPAKDTACAASLNTDDLQLIDSLLSVCISAYNDEVQKSSHSAKLNDRRQILNYNNFAIELKDYQRQYIPQPDSKGQRLVYINCFCSVEEDWKTNEILVRDGGKCYFSLMINLSTKAYEGLSVNGDA